MRCGSAYLLPRLSALGCLTSLACLQPTMPSADFCRPLRPGSPGLSPLLRTACRSPRVRPRTFRAQTPDVSSTPRCGWRTSLSRARSSRVVPHLVSGSCSSPRAFRLGFLQTPPPGDALALLLAFGSARTWREDFHLARSVPCLAHKSQVTGAPPSGSASELT